MLSSASRLIQRRALLPPEIVALATGHGRCAYSCSASSAWSSTAHQCILGVKPPTRSLDILRVLAMAQRSQLLTPAYSTSTFGRMRMATGQGRLRAGVAPVAQAPVCP